MDEQHFEITQFDTYCVVDGVPYLLGSNQSAPAAGDEKGTDRTSRIKELLMNIRLRASNLTNFTPDFYAREEIERDICEYADQIERILLEEKHERS